VLVYIVLSVIVHKEVLLIVVHVCLCGNCEGHEHVILTCKSTICSVTEMKCFVMLSCHTVHTALYVDI
jgi:hypothetical protein